MSNMLKKDQEHHCLLPHRHHRCIESNDYIRPEQCSDMIYSTSRFVLLMNSLQIETTTTVSHCYRFLNCPSLSSPLTHHHCQQLETKILPMHKRASFFYHRGSSRQTPSIVSSSDNGINKKVGKKNLFVLVAWMNSGFLVREVLNQLWKESCSGIDEEETFMNRTLLPSEKDNR